jgi:beta-N-acetylhexosaminidase
MDTLAKQAGELLLVGFEGQECDGVVSGLFRDVQPGGAIFFQRNIATAEQLERLVSQIHELLGGTAFLAVDLEGGSVDRFRDLIAPLPSAWDAAKVGMERALGEVAGREVAYFGLNVDFAPVLDLGLPESKTVLASRTAGSTPEQVVHFGEEFLAGLEQWNVLGCGKHFPGLGSGCKDSHVSMPVIEKPEAELWSMDLAPYAVLKRRLPMIMVAHAWYPALEEKLGANQANGGVPTPASLSRKIVTGLLRERLGYKGIIVCDDLEMGGVLEGRSTGEAAVGAVRAGCDVLLVCRDSGKVLEAHGALVKEAERDATFRQRIEASCRRIREFKRRHLPERGREKKPDFQTLRASVLELTRKIQTATQNPVPDRQAQER